MFNTLVVEDNTTFRQILINLLSYQFPSMVLDEAGSGEEALAKINDRHPNLVFIDIRLPGENGLELTKKIKTTHPETTIIILTNYDLPEYRQAADEYGANYFISKSGASTADDVSALVETIVSKKTLLRGEGSNLGTQKNSKMPPQIQEDIDGLPVG